MQSLAPGAPTTNTTSKVVAGNRSDGNVALTPTPPPHMSDDLGKLASNATRWLHESPSFKKFIWACQGPIDFQPMVGQLPHSAASHLDQYQWHGIPFNTTAPYWTAEQKLMAIKRGAHKSASDCAEFVHKEFVDVVHKQVWVVLPVDAVLELEELRLSPL